MKPIPASYFAKPASRSVLNPPLTTPPIPFKGPPLASVCMYTAVKRDPQILNRLSFTNAKLGEARMLGKTDKFFSNLTQSVRLAPECLEL